MGVGGAAARSLKVKAGQAVCARGVTSAPKTAVRLISRAWLNATHNYDYS
jgi:hypothetical protein